MSQNLGLGLLSVGDGKASLCSLFSSPCSRLKASTISSRIEPEKAGIAAQEPYCISGAGDLVEATFLKRFKIVLLNAQHVSGVGHAVAAPGSRFPQLFAKAREGMWVVAARLVNESRPGWIRLGCLERHPQRFLHDLRPTTANTNATLPAGVARSGTRLRTSNPLHIVFAPPPHFASYLSGAKKTATRSAVPRY